MMAIKETIFKTICETVEKAFHPLNEKEKHELEKFIKFYPEFSESVAFSNEWHFYYYLFLSRVNFSQRLEYIDRARDYHTSPIDLIHEEADIEDYEKLKEIEEHVRGLSREFNWSTVSDRPYIRSLIILSVLYYQDGLSLRAVDCINLIPDNVIVNDESNAYVYLSSLVKLHEWRMAVQFYVLLNEEEKNNVLFLLPLIFVLLWSGHDEEAKLCARYFHQQNPQINHIWSDSATIHDMIHHLDDYEGYAEHQVAFVVNEFSYMIHPSYQEFTSWMNRQLAESSGKKLSLSNVLINNTKLLSK